MGRVGLLSVLWIWSIVGLASARQVVNCLDGVQRCTEVYAVVQGPQDVAEVIYSHGYSRNVDFHGNLLRQFFAGYAQRPRVQWEKLNLSYNLLQDDVFAMLQSPQLKYVDITYNSLTTVTVPSSVVEFIAERNNLTSIKINSRQLERLILPKNKLDSLRHFKNLPQLKELDLSCNQLEKLNSDDLSSMSGLSALHMANNRIHIVEGRYHFSSLVYLDLSSNLLTMIDEPFQSFSSVTNLYLQNNKIVMWIKEATVPRNLHQINVANNDWDCNSLTALKNKIANQMVPGPENVLCTNDDAGPYAGRVIKYRMQEFNALKVGAAQRNSNITCSSFKPNPCEGNENRVYEVARSAMGNVENLAKQTVRQLEGDLRREQNLKATIEHDTATEMERFVQLQDKNQDLINYIEHEYKSANLTGTSDATIQLNEIFEHYERENEKWKNEIKTEERKNEDKLFEINKVGNEIDDLAYHRDNLLKESNDRNSTIVTYKNKIAEFTKKLQTASSG